MTEIAEKDRLATLDEHQHLSLITFRPSGQPVPTTVWFARRDDTLYVITQADSGKISRLQDNPAVTVAPSTEQGKLEGAAIRGRAHVITDKQEARIADEALRAKYGLRYRKTAGAALAGLRHSDAVFLAVSVG